MSNYTDTENSGTISDEKLFELIKRNGLSYSVPKIMSLFSQRQKIRYDSLSSSTAPGGSFSINVSNSDIFVNPKNSYLFFDVTFTGAVINDIPFGSASAANIFTTNRFVHSSSQELCHDRFVNIANYSNDLLKSNVWMANQGANKGYGHMFIANEATTKQTFCIELSDLFTFFDSDQLIPPFAMSGSQLHFNLASLNEAIATVAVTDFSVSNAYVSLDSYILSDLAMSALERLSSKGQVEYQCQGYEVVTGVANNTNSLNLECTKSLGRVNSISIINRPTANASLRSEDSMVPVAYAENIRGISQVQHRLNSMYFPASKATSALEIHIHGRQDVSEQCTYSYTNAQNTFIGQLVHQPLMRNVMLLSSGLPVNSSSALRSEITFANLSSTTVMAVVRHVKIIRFVLYNNVTILV